LHRFDKLKQAISHVKARRTKEWSRFPLQEKRELNHGAYSQEDITANLIKFAVWDSYWFTFFKGNGIQPLFISYEELVENKLLTTAKIFEFLGHTIDTVKMNPEIMPVRQSDVLSEDWYHQYCTDIIHFCD
jgi:LPS sulfotransferase NodH